MIEIKEVAKSFWCDPLLIVYIYIILHDLQISYKYLKLFVICFFVLLVFFLIPTVFLLYPVISSWSELKFSEFKLKYDPKSVFSHSSWNNYSSQVLRMHKQVPLISRFPLLCDYRKCQLMIPDKWLLLISAIINADFFVCSKYWNYTSSNPMQLWLLKVLSFIFQFWSPLYILSCVRFT